VHGCCGVAKPSCGLERGEADLRGKVEAEVSKRASVEARSIGLGAMLGVAEVSVM
jgi:hypothetical protein